MLLTDDWAYYESVVLTVRLGWPTVSDYLGPSTVGLTVPVALVVQHFSDVWLVATAAVGLLGVVGLWSFAELLGAAGVSRQYIPSAILALGFLPIWLQKWTRFESALPALALTLLSFALLTRFLTVPVRRGRAGWLLLLSSSAAMAWAVGIRQNHLIAVPFALGLVLASGRYLSCLIWMLGPLSTFVLLRQLVEPTFFQSYVALPLAVDGFSVESTVTLGFRIIFFSNGLAMSLLTLIDTRRTLSRLKRLPRSSWLVGGATVGALSWYMVVAQKGVTWLVPGSDIGVLNGLAGRFLMVTAVAIGALLWPALAVAPGRLQRGILLAALAYTGPLAVYGGYWDYYVLEPTILLFMYLLTHWLRIDEPDAPATGRWSIAASYVYGCALALAVAALGASVAGSLLGERVIWVGVAVGMLGAGLAYALTRVRPHVRPDGPNRALPSAALALYVATSWYTQRVDIDALHAHTLIMEQAFRSGWAAPGDAGATFGHTAWSAFRYQMEKGSAEARGDPEAALIAWKGMIASSGQWGFTPSVRLHWGSRTDGTPRTAGSGYATIAQGSATVGLVPRRWMLVQVDTPSQAERPTYPHRFLPLTRQEWRLLLHGGGPQSGSPVSGRIELHVTNQQLMAT